MNIDGNRMYIAFMDNPMFYDSGLSIWLSVDPMSDKYPEDNYESTNEWGNCNGTNIYVRSDASARVDAHEIGHTLGIGESVMGLMVSNQRSPLSSNVIDQTDIGSILYRAGYKNDTITEINYGAKNHVKPTQNVRLQLKENLIK